MNAEEVLGKILSNCCLDGVADGAFEILLGSHCMDFKVIVRFGLYDEEMDYCPFEVVSLTMETN